MYSSEESWSGDYAEWEKMKYTAKRLGKDMYEKALDEFFGLDDYES